MATVKLVDMINTRYLITNLVNDLINVLEKCEKENLTLDLADARFGLKCANLLNEWWGRVDMINSEDPELDALIKRNAIAANMNEEDYELIELDTNISIEDVEEMCNTLTQGGKYAFKVGAYYLKTSAALILLIMNRPDIEYDLISSTSKVFSIIRKNWLLSKKEHEDYWMSYKNKVVKVSPDDNGLYGVESMHKMPQDGFVLYNEVVPYDFGNKKIFSWDGSIPVDDEWKSVIMDCIDILTVKAEDNKEEVSNNEGTDVQWRRLTDVLSFRGGN